METQQSLMASEVVADREGGGSNKAAAGAAAVCRQSSTRWTPTTDQIRILKELYYNKGVRSPSAEQIQRICLQLKQYGKIEGKNVFYWFQNHKARERQKKRFINSDNVHHPIIQRSSSAQLLINGKPPAAAEDHHQQQYVNMNNKYSNISQGVCSAAAADSSGGVIGAFNVQTGNYGGYGSINMEKSFRDCSISAGGGTSTTGVGFGSWVGGVDPYGSYSTSAAANFFDMNNIEEHGNFMHQEEEEEEDHHHHHHHQEIETLPLFPMQGEDVFGNKTTTSDQGGVGGGYGYFSGGGGGSGWGGAGFRTSLELSLNSYGYNTPNFY